MKIKYLLPAVLLALLACANASAQYANYIEADRLFKHLAILNDEDIDISDAENFGRYMDAQISRISEYERQRAAATLLITLQKTPRAYISKNAELIDAPRVRYSIEAEPLIYEYLKSIIRTTSYYPNDPLLSLSDRLQSYAGKEAFNESLKAKLGKGVEREKRLAAIIMKMKTDFREDRVDVIRADYLNNSFASLPYPLCVLTRSCPK